MGTMDHIDGFVQLSHFHIIYMRDLSSFLECSYKARILEIRKLLHNYFYCAIANTN